MDDAELDYTFHAKCIILPLLIDVLCLWFVSCPNKSKRHTIFTYLHVGIQWRATKKQPAFIELTFHESGANCDLHIAFF